MAKKKLKAKDVIIPTAFIILATFVFLAGLNLAVQNGITLPGIGIAGIVGSNANSGSSGTSGTSTSGTSGGTTTSGASVIPPNKVGFSMVLLADYTDNTAETIATTNSGGLPTLALIVKINGKPIKDVVGNAIVGVSSPTGSILPSGTLANFKVNFTATNEKTNYVKWHYVEITAPFTNGTISIISLPSLAVLPVEAFSDFCHTLPNGTAVCANPSTTATQHRVHWTVLAQVTVTTPNYGQLAVIAGSTVSTAQFNADGSVTGCTDCGGTNNAPLPSGPSGGAGPNPCPSGNCGGSGPTPIGGTGGTPTTYGGTTACLALFPQFSIACGSGGGGGPGGGGTTTKNTSGSGIGGGGCLQEIPFSVICNFSLLPQSYIPLSTSPLVTLISTPFLLFGLIIYIVVLFVGGYGIYVFFFKKKR